MGKHLSFDEAFKLIEEYKDKNGHCNVPQEYKTESGIYLGVVVSNIRNGRRKITIEQKEKLNSIGFSWKRHKGSISFQEVFNLLKEYKKEYGHCNVPRGYKTESGAPLGEIVSNIRKGIPLTTFEEKARLNEIGFVWRVKFRKSNKKTH